MSLTTVAAAVREALLFGPASLSCPFSDLERETRAVDLEGLRSLSLDGLDMSRMAVTATGVV